MKIIIYITALICSLLASPVLATETGQISMTNMGLKVTSSPESTLYEGDTWMITARNNFSLNEAEIKRAENALAMAKLNLSYTVITAPHDGIMGRRTINIGQLLNPSQQVATIVDSKNIWVTANYREKQMENVKIGGLAKIKVDALGGKVFEGKITAISGATGAKYSAVPLDNSTGNFVKVQQRLPVRIEFTKENKPEDLEQLRAGMNLEVTLK